MLKIIEWRELMNNNYMTNFMSFYEKKKKYVIKKVLFVSMKEKEMEARCKKSVCFHDISDKTKSGKVTAWIEGEKLYVASDGITKFPIDSSWIFANFRKSDVYFNLFEHVETFVFQNVDTSEVEDMSKMFSGLANLKKINLKSFVTSRVESMACMFLGCKNLKQLDLSSFQLDCLSSVIEMFNGCCSLNCLDISGASWEHFISILEDDYDEVFLELPRSIKIRVFSNAIMEFILQMNERSRPYFWSEHNFEIVNKERKIKDAKGIF